MEEPKVKKKMSRNPQTLEKALATARVAKDLGYLNTHDAIMALLRDVWPDEMRAARKEARGELASA
jgi:hypothetical protein